jgi:hypothetical protein
MDNYQSTKYECDSFVSYKDSKEFLKLVSIDNGVSLEGAFNDSAKRNRLIKEFSATHIIELDAQKHESSAILKTNVYALNPYRKDKMRDLPKKLSVSKEIESRIDNSEDFETFYKALHLIPNAISVGASFRNSIVLNKKASGKDILLIEEKELSKIPSLVSSLWIGNINHRYTYGVIDYSFSFFASLNLQNVYSRLSYVETPENASGSSEQVSETKISNINAEDEREFFFEFLSVAPLFGVELSLYAPLGTAFASLSVGPGYVYTNSSESAVSHDYTFVNVFALGYRAFVTDSIFFQTILSTSGYSRKIAETEHFEVDSNSSLLLGVGYYFVNTTSFVNSLF